MNRAQFLRTLRKHCRESGKVFDWQSSEGKGSHGTVYVDGRKTIVKDGELPRVYVDAVLKQLGIDKSAL